MRRGLSGDLSPGRRQYLSQGWGGNFFQRSLLGGTSAIPGGFNDAINQLFDFGFPVYGFRA